MLIFSYLFVIVIKIKILFFLLICLPFILKSQNDNELQNNIFNVYFSKNSDILNNQSYLTIRKNLLETGTQNIRKIKIKGFADSDHNDSFNLDLSTRRAKRVYDFLLTQAVPENMIEMEFLGETLSVSEDKSLNRRVEITISYELYNNNNIKNRRLFIKGKVSNKNDNNPLASTIVIENEKLTKISSSSENGKFFINSGKGSILNFSRDGFLNYTIKLNDSIIKTAKMDTIYLDIKMRPVVVTEKIVFEKIYFYSDSDSLKPESKPELMKLTNILKNDKSILIEIQGHMNCPVSYPLTIDQKNYNHQLSYKRAKAIYNYLTKNGISSSRLTYKGMSNYKMIFKEPKNDAEADKNKRVEVWKLRIIEN